MKILLTGSTGFVGVHLGPALIAAGHELRAMTRHPDDYNGVGTAVYGDTEDEASIAEAATECDAAYYLIHEMDETDDFADRDAKNAIAFGRACAAAGVQQIVYLGGLGSSDDELSEHLQSRRDVETLLGKAGVPVTTLRAALVIGRGSASFELLRQTVAALPVVIVPPKASSTWVQPIAVADAVRYLVGVLGLPRAIGAVLEIGGPDRMTYEDMLHRMASVLGKDGHGVRVPALPAPVAKLGVSLLTDIDPTLAATLLESLGNDVVVTDDVITKLLPGPLATFDEMLSSALSS